jgi:hypothetical protein
MSKSKTPTITRAAFDAGRVRLETEIRSWVESETVSFDAAVTPSVSSDVWSGMPAIDSKAVVRASPIVERLLGIPLDPRMIRRGGYTSIDDLVADLLPKLRESCPVEHSPVLA